MTDLLNAIAAVIEERRTAEPDTSYVASLNQKGLDKIDHLVDGFKIGGADAVLAASIFHFGTYTVRQAKDHIANSGIRMRR